MELTFDNCIVGKIKDRLIYKSADGYFIGISGVTFMRINKKTYGWLIRNRDEYLGFYRIHDIADLYRMFVAACRCLNRTNGKLYRSLRFERITYSEPKFYEGVLIPQGLSVRDDRTVPLLTGVIRTVSGKLSSKSYQINNLSELPELIQLEIARQMVLHQEVHDSNLITFEQATQLFTEIPSGN